MNEKRVAFTTLGCKVNQYETQAMRELFINAGYTDVGFDGPADVYVINTCTVTATGDAKSRQMISRAHSLSPEAKIVVCGCYAQTAPDKVMALPGVSLVIGTQDRPRIVELTEALTGEAPISDVRPLRADMSFEEISAARESRTRASLKIQDGCDRFCTYCAIPYARGPVRSRSMESTKAELADIGAGGYKEVVLTGIHLMSFGRGTEYELSHACMWAAAAPGIERVRLGSLEPEPMSDGFLERLAGNEKLCRHFHLSLQSGSSAVLSRMNRRYDADGYRGIVRRLRDIMPDCSITTDVIAGFPGETDAEFAETMEFCRELRFTKVHVFPYSQRPGTKASRLPGQLSRGEKAERAKQLIALCDGISSDVCRNLAGTYDEVLFEEADGGLLRGHTKTYIMAQTKGDASLAGEIRRVRITGSDGALLVCEII